METAARVSLVLFVIVFASVSASVKEAAPWIRRGIGFGNQANHLPRSSKDAAYKVPSVVTDGLRQLWTQLGGGGAESVAVTETCQNAFVSLMAIPAKNILNASKGVEAIDALGKPGSDVLSGNVQWWGGFDECLDIGEDYVKYWAAPINVTVSVTVTYNVTIIPLHVGICVPVVCNGTDYEEIIAQLNGYVHLVPQLQPYNLASNFNVVAETTSRTVPITTGAGVMIGVCAVFLGLVLLGTLTDIGVKFSKFVCEKFNETSINHSPELYAESSPLLGGRPPRTRVHCSPVRRSTKSSLLETPLELILAFSLFKNVSMILSTKQPPSAITSLNGIRVISMFWVILCHTFLWFLSIAQNPLYVINKVSTRFTVQAITNGFFSVDSFFFLSGVLVSYLTLREMTRKGGRFPVVTYYLHRYLRLTMVYAFVLFFFWQLTVYLGTGPTWQAKWGVGSPEYEMCNKYWWTNLLYINNFYPWDLGQECMGWAWYLANDMQFFVLAPIIIVPLYYLFPVGLMVSLFLLLTTFVANGAIAGTQNFPANTVNGLDVDAATAESNDIYVKPYCRAGPYIVGIVLGFLLFRKIHVKIHWILNLVTYGVIWLVAAGCCFSTVYGLYDSFNGDTLSLAENVSYIMFSRFTWAVGLGLIVFACHNGYGWFVNDFLSMKFWIPLSRLTYTAYLVHPIILTVTIDTIYSPVIYSDYVIAIFAIAMVVLSYGAAAIVAAFVEFPLSNVEMAVFKLVGLKPRESVRRVEASNGDKITKQPNDDADNFHAKTVD